jgi:hypothetical protein
MLGTILPLCHVFTWREDLLNSGTKLSHQYFVKNASYEVPRYVVFSTFMSRLPRFKFVVSRKLPVLKRPQCFITLNHSVNEGKAAVCSAIGVSEVTVYWGN